VSTLSTRWGGFSRKNRFFLFFGKNFLKNRNIFLKLIQYLKSPKKRGFSLFLEKIEIPIFLP